MLIRSLMALGFMLGLIAPAAAAPPPVTFARYGAGAVFITATGKSLYVRDGDEGGRGCVDKCLQAFQPLGAGQQDTGPIGWSIIRRPGGSFQWAYRDRPLYTCAKDATPGAVACEGAENGRWHAARP